MAEFRPRCQERVVSLPLSQWRALKSMQRLALDHDAQVEPWPESPMQLTAPYKSSRNSDSITCGLSRPTTNDSTKTRRFRHGWWTVAGPKPVTPRGSNDAAALWTRSADRFFLRRRPFGASTIPYAEMVSVDPRATLQRSDGGRPLPPSPSVLFHLSHSQSTTL